MLNLMFSIFCRRQWQWNRHRGWTGAS